MNLKRIYWIKIIFSQKIIDNKDLILDVQKLIILFEDKNIELQFHENMNEYINFNNVLTLLNYLIVLKTVVPISCSVKSLFSIIKNINKMNMKQENRDIKVWIFLYIDKNNSNYFWDEYY